jgi:Xaa-Pro aminopeptidase
MSIKSPFDEKEFHARHDRVRERMRADGLDAVIAYSNAKAKGCVRYLSNYFVRFTGAQTKRDGSYFQFGSCAVLFPVDGEPRLLTDQPWDIERAKELSIFSDTAYAENFGTDFGDRIAQAGYKRVGIDNWFLFPAMHYLGLTERAAGVEYVPTPLIEQTYKIKSPREIELVRKAEDVAVKAIEEAKAAVGVGVREFDFALACDYALRKYGDLEVAGSAIVSGGPNTATGSGLPTQEDSYTMKAGDWALFDVCPGYEGYAGDISRMVVAGSISDLDPKLKRMYDVTRELNERVIDAIRPGVTPWALNKMAIEIADGTEFGQYKIDLLGHSLGPDIHDPPDYYYDDSPLEENMTITVEPCLLWPGVAGTRVEDVVLVTADGCEVLSAASPKDLRGTDD